MRDFDPGEHVDVNAEAPFTIPDPGYKPNVSSTNLRTRQVVTTAIAGSDAIGSTITEAIPSFPVLYSPGALAVDGNGPLGAQTTISWNARTGGSSAAADYLRNLADQLGMVTPVDALTEFANGIERGDRDLAVTVRVKSVSGEDRNLVFVAGMSPQTVNVVIKVRDLLEIN